MVDAVAVLMLVVSSCWFDYVVEEGGTGEALLRYGC